MHVCVCMHAYINVCIVFNVYICVLSKFALYVRDSLYCVCACVRVCMFLCAVTLATSSLKGIRCGFISLPILSFLQF